MNKKIIMIGGGLMLFFGLAIFFGQSSMGAETLWRLSNGGTWLFPLISVAALLDSINPCSFSVLLVTIAFLLSIGSVRRRIMLVGGFYVLGIFAVYFLIGLGILQALHLFNTPHFMGRLGASALILLGTINVIGYFVPSFPIQLRIPQKAHMAIARIMEHTTLPAAFLLGSLVGLCEFPCTGGPYLMVLGLLHDQSTYLTGVWYLLWYNMIFVLPLIIMLLIASNELLLEKMRAFQRQEAGPMRLWGSVGMIVLGLLVLWW